MNYFITKTKDLNCIYRHLEKFFLNYMELNNPVNLAQANQISKEELQAMEFIAKVRDSAERLGIPFAGGFITPDKKYFITTNESCDDSQINSITEKLLNN